MKRLLTSAMRHPVLLLKEYLLSLQNNLFCSRRDYLYECKEAFLTEQNKLFCFLRSICFVFFPTFRNFAPTMKARTKDMDEKREKYRLLTEQIRALIEGETDSIAVMANVCAAIHETMGFFWTGFYRVVGRELVLGPFQGPVACMHIGYGRGVCGTAWERRQTIVVPDVEQFPGHIACSSLSRSEIVVPVFSNQGDVIAVLDIDSKALATFDDVDRECLETIVSLL